MPYSEDADAKPAKKALYIAIADQIYTASERKNDTCRLPSIRDIAKQYAISHVTASRAISHLKKQGLVGTFGRHGTRIHTGKTETNISEDHGGTRDARIAAAEKLFAALRERILDGTYRLNERFPKVGHFVRIERVSDRTVRKALELLARNGLAHREGRNWICGPARAVAEPRASLAPPVVLLLQQKEIWAGLVAAERTSRFVAAFTAEAERFGVEVIPVNAVEDAPVWCEGGREAIRDLINQLDTRYAGTLIPSSTSEISNLCDWISWLARFRKPVVWFDRYNENLIWKEAPPGPALFFRCHFDELAGVTSALNALIDLGHRVIAFPNSKGSFDPWVNHRVKLFRIALDSSGTDARFLTQETVDLPWSSADSFRQVLTRWRKTGLPHIRALLDSQTEHPRKLMPFYNSLLYNTPVLMPYLSNQMTTAIVAPNDQLAKEYYIWLQAAGLQIPQDISLVSFDNSLQLHPLPVASVDFGFGHLGFCALHLLLRDIPIPHDRRGNIPAKCRLVCRRSLGKARSIPLARSSLRGEWR